MSGAMGNWFTQLLVELGLRRPRAEDEARAPEPRISHPPDRDVRDGH